MRLAEQSALDLTNVQRMKSAFATSKPVPVPVPREVNPSAFSGTLQGRQESFWISSANESGCILSFKWSGFLLPQNNQKCAPKTHDPVPTFARNAIELHITPQHGTPAKSPHTY